VLTGTRLSSFADIAIRPGSRPNHGHGPTSHRRHIDKVLDGAPMPCGRPQLREMIRDEIGDAHGPSPDEGSTQKRRYGVEIDIKR
jgi:hypothetical protein